jgi:hypothetical protein
VHQLTNWVDAMMAPARPAGLRQFRVRLTNQRRGNVRSITLRSPQERPSSGSYWIKSSLSYANGNCVEVTSLPDGEIGVRNSRDSGGPVLSFTSDEWHAFLGGVRNGEFDGFGR